ICDGYEVTGKRVAVLGSNTHGVAEALFLRTYSDDVTLLTLVKSDLDRSDRAALDKAGIAVETTAASSFEFGKPHARVRLADG
ncbi:thioredoxin reductase, partial [Halomonas sp. ND22Bw]